MRYFVSGAQCKSGCNHEFIKGKWDGKTFWSDDSLILDDDILNDLNVAGLIYSVVPAYDPYGPTEFSWEQWAEIRNQAAKAGGAAEQVILELNSWLGPSSGTKIAFTSLGV